MLPRLFEAGWLYSGDDDELVPQVGARAKIFRRADAAELGFDGYAGVYWVTSESTRREEGRGLALLAGYSYNSPDASNFYPLPRSHVLGIQLVWGNPGAIAPPIATMKVPSAARYEGGAP